VREARTGDGSSDDGSGGGDGSGSERRWRHLVRRRSRVGGERDDQRSRDTKRG
jgi:hypothetical protein